MEKIILIVILAEMTKLAAAGELPWPPDKADSIVGHSVCDLPPAYKTGQYSLPVVEYPDYHLEFREVEDESRAFALLIKNNPKRCDAKVIAAIQLPKFPEKMRLYEKRDRFQISFECRYLGVDWVSNIQALGMVDQKLPAGYFKPRVAWQVDVVGKNFRTVDPNLVVCARFGADDVRRYDNGKSP